MRNYEWPCDTINLLTFVPISGWADENKLPIDHLATDVLQCNPGIKIIIAVKTGEFLGACPSIVVPSFSKPFAMQLA